MSPYTSTQVGHCTRGTPNSLFPLPCDFKRPFRHIVEADFISERFILNIICFED